MGSGEKGRPTSITLIGNLYNESSIINLALVNEVEDKFNIMLIKQLINT